MKRGKQGQNNEAEEVGEGQIIQRIVCMAKKLIFYFKSNEKNH